MKFRLPLATSKLGLWANIARLTRFFVPLRLKPHIDEHPIHRFPSLPSSNNRPPVATGFLTEKSSIVCS